MKFLMLIPATKIENIHRKAPWVEIPLAFGELGWESRLICSEFFADKLQDVKVLKTEIKDTSFFSHIIGLIRSVRVIVEYNPDIILQAGQPFLFLPKVLVGFFDLFKIREEKKKIFWSMKLDWDGEIGFLTNPVIHKVRLWLFSINSRILDHLFVESTCPYNALKKLPLIDIKKVTIINNGFPQDLYSYDMESFKNKSKIILCVARIVPLKGQDLLLNSFIKLSEKYKDWKLIFVGPIEDKEYYSNLLSEIKTRNLERRISFRISISEEELEELYKTSSIFCLPSYKEGFSQVRMEAIANYLPVVTTDAGCGRDLEKYGSFCFQRGDINALTGIIANLMENESLRFEASLEQIKHILTYKDNAKAIISTYQNNK